MGQHTLRAVSRSTRTKKAKKGAGPTSTIPGTPDIIFAACILIVASFTIIVVARPACYVWCATPQAEDLLHEVMNYVREHFAWCCLVLLVEGSRQLGLAETGTQFVCAPGPVGVRANDNWARKQGLEHTRLDLHSWTVLLGLGQRESSVERCSKQVRWKHDVHLGAGFLPLTISSLSWRAGLTLDILHTYTHTRIRC